VSPTRRCLVIHPGALGDVLLALPALAHLGDLGFERVLAAMPRLTALLGGSDYVEAAMDLDGLGLHRLFTPEPDPSVLHGLAAYDAVVSWFGAGDPVYQAHLASLGRPVVVARATPTPDSRRHASRHLLETLAPLGPSPEKAPCVRLALGAGERARAEGWFAARGLAPGEAIVLHPGAGTPAKAWPGFAVLARRLEAAGCPVVVTAGPADGATLARLARDGGLSETRIAHALSLPELAALLGAARAFVGNDSGPSHLAGAVGCPTLALFGPTDPVVWAPGYPPGACSHVRVVAGKGRGGADPWEGLTPARVEAALRELITAASVAPHD